MFDSEYTVIEEISIGNTKMPLVVSPKGHQAIQLWSSLSDRWNVMTKVKVEEAWNSWKILSERIEKKRLTSSQK